MKKFILTILAVAGLNAASSGALLLEESFLYAPGSLSGQGSWSSGSAVQVAAGSLAYAGLQSPTITSNKANLLSSAGTALKSFSPSPITSGSVYVSFLFKHTTLSASTTGGTIAGFDDDGSVSTSSGRAAGALAIHLKQTNTTSYLVGIRKGQGASGAGGGTDTFYPGSIFFRRRRGVRCREIYFWRGRGR